MSKYNINHHRYNSIGMQVTVVILKKVKNVDKHYSIINNEFHIIY